METVGRKITEGVQGLEVKAIGHRVVHGGSKLKKATVITEKVIQEIESNKIFAPVHNPASLEGIRFMLKLYPDIPQVATFDTSFHSVSKVALLSLKSGQ